MKNEAYYQSNIFWFAFTLVVPKYNDIVNEYEIISVSKEKWEEYSECEELYLKRATGKVKKEEDIVNDILRKMNIEIGYVKPQKEIYEVAIGSMKTQAKSCMFVGDGGSNKLKGAKKIGMVTVITHFFRGEPRAKHCT